MVGHHAVIIPAANKRNLLLKQDVIDAVAEGLFSIFAVSNVDETLELLTGQQAGTVDHEGNYPENSINFKAISRLKEISDLANADEEKVEANIGTRPSHYPADTRALHDWQKPLWQWVQQHRSPIRSVLTPIDVQDLAAGVTPSHQAVH